MSKKIKTLIETDGSDFTDEVTVAGNTWVRMSLEKDDCIYNLNMIVSSRTNTDSYTTTTFVGVSPKGIDSIINQLSEIRNKLIKDIK